MNILTIEVVSDSCQYGTYTVLGIFGTKEPIRYTRIGNLDRVIIPYQDDLKDKLRNLI